MCSRHADQSLWGALDGESLSWVTCHQTGSSRQEHLPLAWSLRWSHKWSSWLCIFLKHKFYQVIFLFTDLQWLCIALRINQHFRSHLKEEQAWSVFASLSDHTAQPHPNYFPPSWWTPGVPRMFTALQHESLDMPFSLLGPHPSFYLSTKNQLRCHLFQEQLGVPPLDYHCIW